MYTIYYIFIVERFSFRAYSEYFSSKAGRSERIAFRIPLIAGYVLRGVFDVAVQTIKFATETSTRGRAIPFPDRFAIRFRANDNSARAKRAAYRIDSCPRYFVRLRASNFPRRIA